MGPIDLLIEFGRSFLILAANPMSLALMFGSTFLGIVFGALPGLTATLGVALLTTLTFGISAELAMVALLGIYVGAVYGGSYSAVLINIPGTPASAATAMEGYPMACRGEGGRALGLTTTASAIGTIVGMVFMIVFSPIIGKLALQFTSFEFFLLAFFGIMISGGLVTPDLPMKGWIAGFIGLFIALVGRDRLQFYPRFTFGWADLDGGIDVVPIILGAFGIPQIISALKDRLKIDDIKQFARVLPEFGNVVRNVPNIVRSALIGVGIGAVPGLGEDIAAWTSYGAAKKASKHKEKFGTGHDEGIVATEVANNACIGGALIPLITLGIPGSPPAAMLLGALMLHNLTPGPLLLQEHPKFLPSMTAILLLATIAMWVIGIFLAKQVTKILRVPQTLLMPVVAVFCVIGSYSLGNSMSNLYLMIPIGIVSYFLVEMGYPIAPMVIGMILGPMADESLRRALMVSKGSFVPMFTRPVSLILVVVIVFSFVVTLPAYKTLSAKVAGAFKRNKA
jgi:putative tricarboxylic transport membrane protein